MNMPRIEPTSPWGYGLHPDPSRCLADGRSAERKARNKCGREAHGCATLHGTWVESNDPSLGQETNETSLSNTSGALAKPAVASGCTPGSLVVILFV